MSADDQISELSENAVDDATLKVEKIRKKREINITPEMEAHIDKFGTHCLKCGIKTKDVE